MTREKRICLIASGLLAASPGLEVHRALFLAGKIIDWILRIEELEAHEEEA
jgi:hypothetical protein